MIAGLHLGTELKRFKRARLARVSIVAIILIPLLYSTLYLWAFWDPFGKVTQLPIAFVNDDAGTTVDGQPLNAGDQIVAGLKEKSDEIKFDYVSKQDAVAGVASGKYYFMVELTPDFSQAVASPNTNAPRQAVIQTTYNDTNSYLSTVIGENVMKTLLPVISQQIGAQAVDKVLVGIQSAGTGLTAAAQGASQLSVGAVALNAGLKEAQAGVVQLSAGAKQLDDGAGQLLNGANQLADGTQQLQDQLSAAVDQISGPLADATGKLNNLKAQGDQITVRQQQAAAQIRQIAATLPAPAAGQLNDVANQLAATPQALQDLNTATDLANQASSKIGMVKPAVKQLNDGMHTLRDGIALLKNEGTSRAVAGVGDLQAGADKLVAGSDELAAGSKELTKKLTEGARAIPRWNEEQRQDTASILGGPVALQSKDTAGHNTFGAGLAPFFLSLALFIGGLAIFMLLRPMQQRAIASGVRSWRAAWISIVPPAAIGILQGLVVIAVTVVSVDLRPAYLAPLFFFTAAVSVMFVLINQVLNAWLGPGPGRVAAMALLMLQILSAGGLYPVETEPRLMQILHPLSPMTYAVNGFRQLIYGNTDARLWQACVAVGFIILLCLVLQTLCARRDKIWQLRRLHPAITV